MAFNQKFFMCNHCGNMVGLIENKGVPLSCCGEPMEELVPNTVDASAEKHIPYVTGPDDMISIQVGSVEHPMEEDHYIAFAYLETEKGGQRKNFKPGEPPRCEFRLKDDSPVAVYAYCNKHGLWAREKKFKSPPPVDMLTMRG